MRLLGQKRADILKFRRFVQNSVRNYELLKISVSCEKRKEKKKRKFDLKLARKEARSSKFTWIGVFGQ